MLPITQNPPFFTNTIGVEYQNGWTLGDDHILITGLDWRESRSEHATSGYDERKLRNGAVYLQDTWNFAPKWSLVPGVRVDHHNMFGTHWSPKVAVNYNADDNTQVYASWGRVFKAPTADDLYWNEPGMAVGDPDLKPESGHTETIGVTHKLNDKTTVAASYFWSEIHNAIYWPWIGVSKATNIGQERKHGLELSVQKKFNDHWSVDAAYSYTHLNMHGDTRDNNISRSMRNGGPNGYRLGVHYKQGPWKANLMATIGSGLDTVTLNGGFPYYNDNHYTLLDFNASYDINKNLTAYFKANNLLNQEYLIYPGTTWSYPGKGRFFQIGLTCSF